MSTPDPERDATEKAWVLVEQTLLHGFASRHQGAEDAEAMLDIYRLLLADKDPRAVLDALRALVQTGQKWRPEAATIRELLEHRPELEAPTWDEARELIWGPDGILNARPVVDRTPGTPRHSHEQLRELKTAAIIQAAQAAHPHIENYIATIGLDRLRAENVHDPDYGGARLHALRETYAAVSDRGARAQLRQLTTGPGTAGGMRKLNASRHLHLDT